MIQKRNSAQTADYIIVWPDSYRSIEYASSLLASSTVYGIYELLQKLSKLTRRATLLVF